MSIFTILLGTLTVTLQDRWACKYLKSYKLYYKDWGYNSKFTNFIIYYFLFLQSICFWGKAYVVRNRFVKKPAASKWEWLKFVNVKFRIFIEEYFKWMKECFTGSGKSNLLPIKGYQYLTTKYTSVRIKATVLCFIWEEIGGPPVCIAYIYVVIFQSYNQVD